MGQVRNVVIVLAAGAGRRIGAEEPKAFLRIGGRPMAALAAAAAAASPAVDALVVTAPEGWEPHARSLVEDLGKPAMVVSGGATRHASVRAAIEALVDGVEVVACHDAARPFAPPDLFTAVIEAAGRDGAEGAIPVLPVTDTVKRLRDGMVVGTEARDELGLAQTPQAFRAGAFLDAHARAERAGLDLSDDAAVLEWAGYRVRAVPGDPGNFKVTTLGDLARAEARMTEELGG
ncbi:MAG: 2-C-methyl-D-erythritol 4-phosphate cytidylyltransferase [Actinobacteria bacterium]|nr:2-C-methyl-D-erythritol 4-phosphate cytidylyltransferase [Actinomycetota bacterium]